MVAPGWKRTILQAEKMAKNQFRMICTVCPAGFCCACGFLLPWLMPVGFGYGRSGIDAQKMTTKMSGIHARPTAA